MPQAVIQYARLKYRGCAYPSEEIGGSDGQVAPASGIPIDPAGTRDTAHLLPQFSFEGRRPGYELKAKTVVDHCEPTRCQRQSLTIGSRYLLTCLSRQMRQACFRSKIAAHSIELATSQRPNQIAAEHDLPGLSASKSLIGEDVDPPIECGTHLGSEASVRKIRVAGNQPSIEPGCAPCSHLLLEVEV